MPLDFSGQSLVGRSFKGKNLAEANFSGADIRSANFAKANLHGANFHQTVAGLSKSRQLLQCLVILLCSVTLGMVSVVVGTFTATFWLPKNVAQFTLIPGLLCLLSVTAMGFPFIYQGFTPRAFQNTMIVCAVFIAGISASLIGPGSAQAAYSAGSIASAVVLILTNIVILTTAGLIGGKWLVRLGIACSIVSSFSLYDYIYPHAIKTVTGQAPDAMGNYLLNHVGMVIVIAEIAIAGTYVASRVLAKDDRFDLVQNVAATLTTLGGTNFHRANLTEANCTAARLKCTDLSKATLERTDFHNAQQLYTSKLNGTILAIAPVRRLAISKNGHQQTYQNLNLQGINLTDADLTAANFTGSNLNQATLAHAVLPAANLTKIQAIGTHFQHAQLTGACIEAWNIDNSTQLTDIDCQYIYRRNHQQERRPSSGIFGPGEFAQLFQEVIDTIDLIFQNGIDWQALNTMLAEANQTRREQNSPQPPTPHAPLPTPHSQNPMGDQHHSLAIRSIENKTDGAVVVRIDAPPNADKADLHQNLTELYNNALKTIEASFQKQIQAKDEQIESYRQQQSALNQILLKQNKPQAQTLPSKPSPTKLVHLKLTSHPSTHHLINLQIGEEGKLPFLDTTATLPSSQEVFTHYQQWQASYRQHLIAVSSPSRIEAPQDQLTNVSIQQLQQELRDLTQQVHHSFNWWLTDKGFRPLREKLLENLNPNDSIRIVLQTDNPQLWQLPWHSWEILERYPRSELTISTHHYQYRDVPTGIPHPPSDNNTINILAVLGSNDDLDVQVDCDILKNLPHSNLTVLTEPSRQTLNNQLWDHPCDILFFAGHSTSAGGQGILRLNPTDSLTLSELKHALQRACQRGLQLAIFNSCDGLGLVHGLSDLSLQQMIVMREAVPDRVAQVFLANLLTAFAKGQSLPQSVREAREKLQGLENRFPCATWLPVLCQTAATPPLTWADLKRG
ncbi:MAG: pentapeptide repeat-containing protein [Cyanobacteria bacterium J06598_3]